MRSLARAALIAAVVAFSPAADAQTGDRFFIVEAATPNPAGDVLEVAAAPGQFTRFLAAVDAAGYSETLRGEGPFTIFAPTDEAFRRMDQRELEQLMRPQQHEELLALLAYHVVLERITRESVGRRVTRLVSATGFRITVDGRDGLRINDQLVVMPDIEASNGVIQGINTASR
jgi:uncharacterized surface protein with fasciclin (FAS1) repeats